MKKHESYYTYYPESRLSLYLSKGAFWVLLDVLSAFMVVLLVLGFFSFLSTLQAGV